MVLRNDRTKYPNHSQHHRNEENQTLTTKLRKALVKRAGWGQGIEYGRKPGHFGGGKLTVVVRQVL